MRLAVVKPDHLGDLVMALPALRALRRSYPDLVLYVSSSTYWLAEKLLPGIALRHMDAPHLTRDSSRTAKLVFSAQVAELQNYDAVVVLRNDHVFRRAAFGVWAPHSVFIEDRMDRHATALERDAVRDFVKPYDVTREFFPEATPVWPKAPSAVGLSIGAGVTNKKWSPLHWAQLAMQLRAAGMDIKLLSGPRERAEAQLIATSAGIDPSSDVIVGGKDLDAFDGAVSELDLIVAADGGTAHLVSRIRPVLSIFGSSPFRRYCPIGPNNRVLTLALPCSPCPGFDVKLVNACLTHECLYGVTPEHVMLAILAEAEAAGAQRTLTVGGPWPVQLHYGLSAAA